MPCGMCASSDCVVSYKPVGRKQAPCGAEQDCLPCNPLVQVKEEGQLKGSGPQWSNTTLLTRQTTNLSDVHFPLQHAQASPCQ
jgi:hypothetical protein